MTEGRVRRGRPGHDREAVLRAAVGLFTERGFEAATIEELARRLGVSKAAVYHHIESKDALLGLALDRALSGLEGVATRVDRGPGSALARLEFLVRDSVAELVAQLPYVTLLLRVRGNSELERQALARRRRLDHLAAGLVRQAIEDGALRGDLDPARTSRLIFGTINSLTEWLRPGLDLDAVALADAVTVMIFDGLRGGGSDLLR